MIVEKVKVTPRKASDLRECVVHHLRVEGAPTFKEAILVTEGTMMRAAPRHDDGVGHEIPMPLDEIPANRGKTFKRANCRFVASMRRPSEKVLQEPRKGVFARPENNRVRVQRRFLRQRCDVQPSKDDISAPSSIVVREFVRTPRVRDVDLDENEVGVIVQVYFLDMLILDRDLEIRI
jgi:hypothetical protein